MKFLLKRIIAVVKNSVINMYRAGIINGGDNNMFNPTSTIQRKDTAVILRRFEVIYMYL